MKARRVVAALAAAGAMVVGGAVSASANIAWCMEDPPVVVQTSAGTNLTVNTSVTVPNYQAKFVNQVAVSVTTSTDGASGTLVAVTVSVPATIDSAHVTATVKKYRVSASTTVAGGGTATLYLDVPTT